MNHFVTIAELEHKADVYGADIEVDRAHNLAYLRLPPWTYMAALVPVTAGSGVPS
jgi:hypothetical protein